MLINKIGKDHLDIGKNNQDFGIDISSSKIVCDGCSEGEHSEVGAKSYCHLRNIGFSSVGAFEDLIKFYGNDAKTIRNYMCFTILEVDLFLDEFLLSYCGDGFVILQDNEGNITFEELTDGEYPKYYAYNYTDRESLKHYKDGVNFEFKMYPTTDYKNVGIASDGLRFVLKENEEFQQEFNNILKSGSEVRKKRFINKHKSVFKDDITKVF
jgi:hypothetical protein